MEHFSPNFNEKLYKVAMFLREKSPSTEWILVRIFLYSDWIRTRNHSLIWTLFMQFFVYLVTLTLLHLSSLPVCTPLYEHLSIPYRKHFRILFYLYFWSCAFVGTFWKIRQRVEKGALGTMGYLGPCSTSIMAFLPVAKQR